jgi:fibronectin-binding autotransporter adhesin
MIRQIARLGLMGLALLIVFGFGSAPALATKYWKNSVITGNWNVGNNWSAVSPAGVDNGGIPGNEAVNIVFTDGTARSVTYNFLTDSYGALSIDQSGAGTATSTLSISVPLSILQSSGLYVGGYSGVNQTVGRGVLNQSAGTVSINSNTDLILGHGANSTGAYTLSGGLLVADQSELIGYSGTGTFTQSGGINQIQASAIGFFALGNNTNSTGTYNLSELSGASELGVNASEYIGNSGAGFFNQNGGTNTVSGVGHRLYLGNAASGTGTYTLNSGTLTAYGNEYIGNLGTGIFNQMAGVNNVGLLFVGLGGAATSTYNLSNGSLSTTYEGIGNAGNGTMNQSGGTNTVTGGVEIGTTSGKTGTFTLSAGSASIGNGIFVGGIGAFSAGTGVLTVSGTGVITVGGPLTIYNTAGTSVNLSGGTINAAALNFGGVPALFHWTSGKLNLNSDVVWDSLGAPTSTSAAFGSSLVLGSNQTLMVTGNETLGGTGFFSLSLNSGSVHNVTGGITLTPNGAITQNTGSTLSAATITQAGGGVYGTLQNQGSFIYQSGPFYGRLLNQGMVSLGPSFTAPNGVENDTSMTVAVGQTLTLDGAGLDNRGSFALAGGTINGSGPLANNAVLTGSGTLAGSGGFTNNAQLTVSGGNLTLSKSGANGNAGNIDMQAGWQLMLTGGNLANSGTINLGGGTVSGTATLNNTTGIISGHGTISSPLINAGSVVVDTGILSVTSAFTNSGEVFLGGEMATLNGSGTISNTGLIRGDGVVAKAVNNNAGGEIRAENGKRVKLQGANGTNAGKVNLQGGTAEFAQVLTNGSNGQIEGRGTLITGGAGLTNNGSIALSSGITDVFGDVNNATGSATKGITISGNADVTFWDDVTNGIGSLFKVSSGSSVTVFGTYSGAGITGTANDIHLEADVSPGFSPATVNFGGNLHFTSTTRLKIELGGTTEGIQYDQVHVSEQLSLDGTLQVSLISSFAPAAGDSFDILDWGSLSGAFSAINLPTLTGLVWNTSQLYTIGVLRVVAPGLLGDYNNNGVVDAADYVVWRKGLGTTYSQADYDVWRAHFGQSAASGSVANVYAAVPEPASLVLLTLAVAAGVSIRRRW